MRLSPLNAQTSPSSPHCPLPIAHCPLPITHHPPLPLPSPLIRPSRLLTRLQLFHIPATDRHITLILIHAAGKVAHIGHAGLVLRTCVATRGLILAAGIEPVIHGLGVGVLAGGSLLRCNFRGGVATAEEAADGVADGGADCDAAVGSGWVSMYGFFFSVWKRKGTTGGGGWCRGTRKEVGGMVRTTWHPADLRRVWKSS